MINTILIPPNPLSSVHYTNIDKRRGMLPITPIRTKLNYIYSLMHKFTTLSISTTSISEVMADSNFYLTSMLEVTFIPLETSSNIIVRTNLVTLFILPLPE